MHTYLFSPSWLSQRSSMDLLGFFASIRQSDTFFGISFQVWIFVILGAVTWAATWVLNLKPAKDRRDRRWRSAESWFPPKMGQTWRER